MSLGTNISRLRAERHLSQGDLADALDVSRQSVSKWETDSSVPDLDKLVKLSRLFGVTLDELVTGAAPSAGEAQPPEAGASPAAAAPGRMPGRKIAGVVLFSMAFLAILVLTAAGGILTGLFLAVPFLVCGSVCFAARKRPGLWCAWALYLMFVLFCRWGTSLNWRYIRYTFSWQETDLSLVHIVMAWVQVLAVLALLTATVRSFRSADFPPSRRNAAGLAALWLGSLAAYFLPITLPLFRAGLFTAVHIVSTLQEILALCLLAAALTLSARCICAWRSLRR